MLDNDNIMTVKASEVVQKVPTDKKGFPQIIIIIIIIINISLVLIRKRFFLSHIYRNRLFRPLTYKFYKT